MSVVTLAEARSPSDPPRFELHIATEEGRVIDGTGHAGNPDLVVEFAMTRARGVALVGPPPPDVIAAVNREVLLRVMAEDLRWAVETDQASYAVLNACRCLRFLREGALGSKLEAGEWAIQEGVGDADLIGAALNRQRGADRHVDRASAATFAETVRDELEQIGSRQRG